MGKNTKRAKVDKEFYGMALDICSEVKKKKKIKRYDVSDLTVSLKPILEEMRRRL